VLAGFRRCTLNDTSLPMRERLLRVFCPTRWRLHRHSSCDHDPMEETAVYFVAVENMVLWISWEPDYAKQSERHSRSVGHGDSDMSRIGKGDDRQRLN